MGGFLGNVLLVPRPVGMRSSRKSVLSKSSRIVIDKFGHAGVSVDDTGDLEKQTAGASEDDHEVEEVEDTTRRTRSMFPVVVVS